MTDILSYPFDSAAILKNRKAIKRQLLSDGSKRLKKNIAVLGGSTTSGIIPVLELFLLGYGIEPAFYESEYNRFWQDAMFGKEVLERFAPDIVYIHTSSRNIVRFPKITDKKEDADSLLEKQYSYFSEMWANLKQVCRCPVIQNNFEYLPYRLLGNLDASDYRGRVNFINRLNLLFCEYAQTHTDFYINDINYLSACYGLDRWSETSYWYMYKYALCTDAIPYLAHNVANIIKAVFGKNRKVLALDLDNTLWGGVIGDDGREGIAIGQETAESQSFTEFQQYIKEHRDMGVLLAVCSKNDEKNAISGLEHPDCVLKPDDFTVIKANWENKDKNISDIAVELNILEESIVFVDDNAAERNIVRNQLPAVAVPEIGSPEDYIRVIDRSGFFEAVTLSEEDLLRNKMYRANAERAKQEGKYSDYNEYLRSLDMKAYIGPFPQIYLPRIAQLTNKSNQFNLTTRRYTPAEIESVASDNSFISLCGKLSDRFGDNGVVSVVIGKIDGSILNIDLWIMSCRVLKRGMEYAMLNRLTEEARKRGIEAIYGYYYPTAKNGMVKELYGDFGFEKISCDEDGNTVWRLDIAGYEAKHTEINITERF